MRMRPGFSSKRISGVKRAQKMCMVATNVVLSLMREGNSNSPNPLCWIWGVTSRREKRKTKGREGKERKEKKARDERDGRKHPKHSPQYFWLVTVLVHIVARLSRSRLYTRHRRLSASITFSITFRSPTDPCHVHGADRCKAWRWHRAHVAISTPPPPLPISTTGTRNLATISLGC